MSRFRSAQSVIEYAVITVVVVLAIVFGGPFLVNSINARFMIMDNNAQDATYEDMKQADVQTGDVDCSCTPADDNPTTWIRGACGAGNCLDRQRFYRRTCTPMGCDDETACVSDSTCCSDPMPANCGDVVSPGPRPIGSTIVDECATRAEPNAGMVEQMTGYSGILGRCVGDDLAQTKHGCFVGEMTYVATCGTPAVADYVCVPEPACQPKCVNNTDSTDEIAFCPSSEEQFYINRELYFREHGGISTGQPDNPSRLFYEIPDPNYSEPQALEGTYRLPFAYVAGSCSGAGGGGPGGLENPADPLRGCERICVPPAMISYIPARGYRCSSCPENPRYSAGSKLPEFLIPMNPEVVDYVPIDPKFPNCVECNKDPDCRLNGGSFQCKNGRCATCKPPTGIYQEFVVYRNHECRSCKNFAECPGNQYWEKRTHRYGYQNGDGCWPSRTKSSMCMGATFKPDDICDGDPCLYDISSEWHDVASAQVCPPDRYSGVHHTFYKARTGFYHADANNGAGACLRVKPDGTPMQDWGQTGDGIQVGCVPSWWRMRIDGFNAPTYDIYYGNPHDLQPVTFNQVGLKFEGVDGSCD